MIALDRASGAKIIGYYFETRLADYPERNRQRAGKARIRDVTVHASRG